ncbi:hypothetical protein B0T16DRAFT_198464 [Cercophora newfieldiana]|uniref:Secreted protein n=1 Tax=Cercophora newfieldiana TaxID=92897 RepID=A0AA40CMM0_9PEZI|nr:hypothetical protein B0T16DRAFT_198464 [Cercophora newfieldiana]
MTCTTCGLLLVQIIPNIAAAASRRRLCLRGEAARISSPRWELASMMTRSLRADPLAHPAPRIFAPESAWAGEGGAAMAHRSEVVLATHTPKKSPSELLRGYSASRFPARPAENARAVRKGSLERLIRWTTR